MSLPSNLYWRVHPYLERPFSIEDATSTTFHSADTRPGYSCFANPWHLFLYLDANNLYQTALHQEIIAFSGTPIGTGADGEILAMPDMAIVRRFSLVEWEAQLATTPLPDSPKFSDTWTGRNGDYLSWAKTKAMFESPDYGWTLGSDPVIDVILKAACKTASPSCEGEPNPALPSRAWPHPAMPGPASPSLALLSSNLSTEATWSDVRTKAREIRASGGVKIIAINGDTITAQVQGAEHVYQTSLIREPGTRRIAFWECSCPWASYSWGRSGRWKKFEGRLCSHALALSLEAQSQEWMGGEITEGEGFAEAPFFYEAPPIKEWRMDTPTAPRSGGDDLGRAASRHTAVATGKRGARVWRGFNMTPWEDSTGTPYYKYNEIGMHPELVEFARKIKDGTLTFAELARHLRTEGVGSYWAEYGPHASEGGRTGEEVARSYSGGVRGVVPGAGGGLEEPFSKYYDDLPGNGEMAIVLVAELAEDAAGFDGEGMLELDEDHPLRLLEVQYNGGWGWHSVQADGRRITAALKTAYKEVSIEELRSARQPFITLCVPQTFSGWKAHIYCETIEDVISAYHRIKHDLIADEAEELGGWGAKVATQAFFNMIPAGHKQFGKGVTLYFPQRAAVHGERGDIDWLVREMAGWPVRLHQCIQGDDYYGNGVGVRFEFSYDPEEDVDIDRYQELYKSASGRRSADPRFTKYTADDVRIAIIDRSHTWIDGLGRIDVEAYIDDLSHLPVGRASITQFDGQGSIPTGWVVALIAVDEALRGFGVATKMVRAAEAHVGERVRFDSEQTPDGA